ncbi:hypothetical protein [Mycobacterium sp.]|uniref:hypothetical protein n=1 Tax=Mycobacterium sp. TaxID=1785 RepID=UPI003A875000
MKLARPDIFHPRIVLAGSRRYPDSDGDDAGLTEALRHRGLHARWLPWDDPQIDDAHLVILRATGDVSTGLDEFLTWTHRVANLLNPADVVAWNIRCGYLDDLVNRGVPVVPGSVCAPGSPVALPDAGPVFVGPAIGSGRRRFGDRRAAAAHVARCHEAGRSVLVQAGGSAPRTVLIFLGGKPSHAFTEHADGLRQGELDFELWDAGAAALAAAAGPAELLYAGVHLIGDRVLELQLVDPSLGWQHLDLGTRERAQREFAVAVESACERLGLGPLSRRRP